MRKKSLSRSYPFFSDIAFCVALRAYSHQQQRKQKKIKEQSKNKRQISKKIFFFFFAFARCERVLRMFYNILLKRCHFPFHFLSVWSDRKSLAGFHVLFTISLSPERHFSQSALLFRFQVTISYLTSFLWVSMLPAEDNNLKIITSRGFLYIFFNYYWGLVTLIPTT